MIHPSCSPQRQHRHLRPVEQPEGLTGIPQPPGDEQRGAVGLIEPGGIGGEEGAVGAHQTVSKGEADEAAVAVAGED